MDKTLLNSEWWVNECILFKLTIGYKYIYYSYGRESWKQ